MCLTLIEVISHFSAFDNYSERKDIDPAGQAGAPWRPDIVTPPPDDDTLCDNACGTYITRIGSRKKFQLALLYS